MEIEGSKKGPDEGEVDCNDAMFAEYYGGESQYQPNHIGVKKLTDLMSISRHL